MNILGIALNWLRVNWQTVVVGIAIVALCVYVGALKLALGSAQGELAKVKGEYSELTSEYKILAAKTSEQSAAIDKLHAESERKRQAGILALAAAKKRAVDAQRMADWLAEQLSKPANGKTCGDAFKSWRTH